MKLFSVRVRVLPEAEYARDYLAKMIADAGDPREEHSKRLDAAKAALRRTPAVAGAAFLERDATRIAEYCRRFKGVADVAESGDRFFAVDPRASARGNQPVLLFERAGRVVRFGEEAREHPSERKALAEFQARGVARREAGWLLAESPREAYLALVESSPEIEARCREPGDEGCRVYADWLQERGDPRGELLAAEHALLREGIDAGEAARLKDHERALFEANRRHLLGPLLDSPRVRVTWRHGWIDEVEVVLTSGNLPALDPAGIREVIGDLLAVPAARLLQGFVCREYQSQPVAAELLAAGPPRTLRRLELGPGGFDSRTSPHVDPNPLLAALPLLDSLTMTSQALDVSAIPSERMRVLSLTGEAGEHTIRSLAGRSWPRLERLALRWNASTEYAPADEPPKPETFKALFAAELPALHDLDVTYVPGLASAIDALVRSPVLARLRTLRLSGPDEAAASRILDDPMLFRHLKKLTIGGWLSQREAEIRNVLGPIVEFVRH